MTEIRLTGTDEDSLSPETWLEMYGDYLFRYALRRLMDRTLAEDLVQETFLAAIAMQGSFQGRSSFRSWLLGILRHKIIDQIRRSARERPVGDVNTLDNFAENLFDEQGEWGVAPLEWKDDPSRNIEREEFWTVLSSCLRKLPDKMADSFILRELEELDAPEICSTLGVTPTNLGVLLYRARLRLRHCLEINWFS